MLERCKTRLVPLEELFLLHENPPISEEELIVKTIVLAGKTHGSINKRLEKC